jgi:rhamnose transport system ATP-binding protein
MPAPLLQLSGIEKSFLAVRALRGVSFDLLPGEVHALLGENGAGKSTLIKVITGAHLPDAGAITLDGKTLGPLTPASAKQLGIAAIYQQPALFNDLSVAENIALALEPPQRLRFVSWRARRQKAIELLAPLGVDINPDAPVRSLSMPQQQLVEIAKALGTGAKILILDEPTASLTSREVDVLMQVVKDLRAKGVGLIYISHRLEEIFQIADRVTVLRDGESVGTYPVRDMNEPTLIRHMVGRDVAQIYPPSATPPRDVVLEVTGLSCRQSGLKDVSFSLRQGEVLGFAGLVGAGRTELARVLFGMTPADTGTIRLRDTATTIQSPQDAVRQGIGYVPEDRRRHGVILEMPVTANMTMSVHQQVFPGRWLRYRDEKLLAKKYVGELGVKTSSVDAAVGTLSGGNQQKVALARWLATKPSVLILDEPTQGVDVGAKAEIHKLIRELTAQGLAVMMISSDLPEVLGMSDRIAVMRGGTIATILDKASATPDRVMAAALGKSPVGGAA